MSRPNRWIALVVMVAALGVSACNQTSDKQTPDEPAKVVPIGNGDLHRVTLSPQAARRLAVRTAPVQANSPKTIPYSALLYTADGKNFVYTSPSRLAFVREPVKVRRIVGDSVILTEGPSEGMEVVTVGAQEIYGAESGVDE